MAFFSVIFCSGSVLFVPSVSETFWILDLANPPTFFQVLEPPLPHSVRRTKEDKNPPLLNELQGTISSASNTASIRSDCLISHCCHARTLLRFSPNDWPYNKMKVINLCKMVNYIGSFNFIYLPNILPSTEE